MTMLAPGRPRAAIDARVEPGLSPAIDEAAACADPHHAFLRRAWYGEERGAVTLVARRADGSPLAALPLRPAGPALLGVRQVPGSYWPYRSVPVAADARGEEIAAFLSHAMARRALGRAWRIGPVYADDPAVALLARAAVDAGWTCLTRPLGTTFLLDIPAAQDHGPWPRPSTLRKLRAREKQLAALGPLRWTFARGADWSDTLIEQLRQVEAESWVGRDTDGSGAKFLTEAQRAYWQGVLADPALAALLSASLLEVSGRPVAFSFDLNVGALQYGIASSYDAAFARQGPGTLLTYRHVEESMARGITHIDWGAGDGGYKRALGAVPDAPIRDLLFVRNRALAALARRRWESGGQPKAAA